LQIVFSETEVENVRLRHGRLLMDTVFGRNKQRFY